MKGVVLARLKNVVAVPAAAAVLAALIAAAPATAATATVRASAALTPRAILFGDEVHARIDVVVDARVVDPAQIELSAPLGSWVETGATSVRTTGAGSLLRRSFDLTITCRTAACISAGASRVVELPAATVTARRRDGRTVHLAVLWPSLVVASRLPSGAATAAKPPFQLQVVPPAPRTRISGAAAPWLFGGAAGVLVAFAVGCAAFELRRRGHKARPPIAPLARALALAREAESRPPEDRRRALALLARVVPTPDDGVSSAAAAAAWTQEEPSPEELAELIRRVEEREQQS